MGYIVLQYVLNGIIRIAAKGNLIVIIQGIFFIYTERMLLLIDKNSDFISLFNNNIKTKTVINGGLSQIFFTILFSDFIIS